MNLSRLLPLIVMGAIAWHSKVAVKRRVAALDNIRYDYAVQNRMNIILRAAKLNSLGEQNYEIRDLRAFIRENLRGTGGDPSVDPWGTPYRHVIRDNQMTIFCAGPDKRFGTPDDVKQTAGLSEF